MHYEHLNPENLTEDQAAVRDALIESDAGEATFGVTEDETAVGIQVGDAEGYFAPYEVQEISMAVTAAHEELPEELKKALNYALMCAEVVEGEKEMADAKAEAIAEDGISVDD